MSRVCNRIWGNGQWSRSGVTEEDIYTFIQTADTTQRIARYRQEAEKFRQMARAEKDGTRVDFFLIVSVDGSILLGHVTPADNFSLGTL